MSLPPFHDFCLPTLSELLPAASGVPTRELFERVPQRMGLALTDLSETISSGQLTVDNRIGWALSYMKKAGWVENPRRAIWTITVNGKARLAANKPVGSDEMRPAKDAAAGHSVPGTPAPVPALAALTPTERIEAARIEILADVETTVLQRLGAVKPKRFELIVLELLARMGYAGSLGSAAHAGQSGDGGIDGILYLDRLQLERVYIQAKRWQGAVGASVVRDFAGAMDGESATKGVILTTSAFTPEARKYVEKSPKAIRLVAGQELAHLMVEFDVGAQPERVLKIPRVDEDFFEDA